MDGFRGVAKTINAAHGRGRQTGMPPRKFFVIAWRCAAALSAALRAPIFVMMRAPCASMARG
jgi:hypothetical protein